MTDMMEIYRDGDCVIYKNVAVNSMTLSMDRQEHRRPHKVWPLSLFKHFDTVWYTDWPVMSFSLAGGKA